MIKNIIIVLSILLATCCNSPVKGRINNQQDTVFVYLNVTDTTYIDSLKTELAKTKDSLRMIENNIGSDLFVANYKLGRIKYYNDIAKGTNIKYLRGWIYRVLNE